jgi:hypothetical protein
VVLLSFQEAQNEKKRKILMLGKHKTKNSHGGEAQNEKTKNSHGGEAQNEKTKNSHGGEAQNEKFSCWGGTKRKILMVGKHRTKKSK